MNDAAPCYKGFVKCFQKVPFACLGSTVAAVQWRILQWRAFETGTDFVKKVSLKNWTQPNAMACKKHFTKPSEEAAAPDRI